MHRVGAALGAVLLVVVAPLVGSAASADGAGGAITDGTGVDYGAIAQGGATGGSRPASTGKRTHGPSCTYELMGGPQDFPVFDVDGSLVQVNSGGNWYEKTCDGVFAGAVYLTGPPDAVDPAAVAAGVFRRMNIPLPDVALSPTGDQVVNLPTWFWIPNWGALTGTATVGGVTVTVTAKPNSVSWDFGDGATSSCSPGIAWSPSADESQACTHTWRRSSAARAWETYGLKATVRWTASYSVSGGAGGGTRARARSERGRGRSSRTV